MTEFKAPGLRMPIEAGDPAPLASNGKWFTKDVGGTAQLFYEASDGTTYTMTPVAPAAGSIGLAALSNALTFGPHTLTNTTPAQNLFAPTRCTYTLAANTYYQMRANIWITRTGGAQVQSLALSFAGTATFSRFTYVGQGWSAQVSTPSGTAQTTARATSTAATTIGLSTGNSRQRILSIEGSFETLLGGTFTPQVAFSGVFSTTPGDTATVTDMSYMELIELGADTFVKQGAVA